MKQFYRVCNTITGQGVWYDFQGKFTGLIHDKFNFCTHKDLKMDFDQELVGWLSAADTEDALYFWFPKEDILKLQEYGYLIHVYETDACKYYNKFQHYVISQSSSRLVKTIKLF